MKMYVSHSQELNQENDLAVARDVTNYQENLVPTVKYLLAKNLKFNQ